ncbi:CAP domain-containing protein [Georgenia halophila]|uniref:CAP domain-containing protein n=1 Tax=Georgenia halophila TaxID=620889 RepID=UPI0031E9F247
MRVTATAVMAAVAGTLLSAVPATAQGGEVGGSGNEYFLNDSWSGEANTHIAYGRPDDLVYVGDWDGNGTDTLALRRGSTFYISNSNSGGSADHVVAYGRPGDVVLAGDWDGDGDDTFAVRRGSEYHVKNSLSGGPADVTVAYGRADDEVLVGDWDGDGDDTFAVRRGSHYYVKNSIAGGPADTVVAYGRVDDDVYVGDFDGDGDDTFTVRRGTRYYIANEIRGGEADRTVVYGRPADTTLVGDWNGDGADTLGVRRPVESAPGPVTPVPGAENAFDARMVELINDARVANGAPPLTYWDPLRDGALDHSRWMGEIGQFQHASSSTLWSDTAEAGCARGYGENIFTASYRASPEAAMEAYMNSPGHRANILSTDLRYVATGTLMVDGDLYNTQRFAVTCG